MSEAVIERSELPDDLPPADAPEDISEEAPYGYKADGTPRKKPGRPKGSAGVSGGSSRKLESLREPLTQRLVEYFGGPLVMVSPIAAAVWEERAEKTADAILVLAARSVRWRKWVERLIAGSAAGDLGITLVGVGTGMLVDAGRIAPDGKLASFYGIPELYQQFYGEYVAAQNGGAEERGLYAEVS